MVTIGIIVFYCNADYIQNQATFEKNEPLGDIDDEGEPTLSLVMITTNYDRQYRLLNDHGIDMISPSDNDIEELQSDDNVSSPAVSSSSTSSGANTGKQTNESLRYANSWWWCSHWSRCLHYATKIKIQRWFNSKQEVLLPRTPNSSINAFDYFSTFTIGWPVKQF